jgi:23S rRNA (cytidine1920-2'-O)/16S rRNA (cytidine1409-2'-O)-methyltransferase
VVREKSTHLEVIEAVMAFAQTIGFGILNLEFSPIKGPEGNIEYLLHLQNHPLADGEMRGLEEESGKAGQAGGKPRSPKCPVDARVVVEAAHKSL